MRLRSPTRTRSSGTCARAACCASCAALALLARTAAAVEPAPAPVQRPLYWRLKASIGYHFSRGDYTGTEPRRSSTCRWCSPPTSNAGESRARFPTCTSAARRASSTGPDGPIQTTNGTSDGLGDVLLRGSYLLPMEAAVAGGQPLPLWLPFVDLVGLVKFPTGSRSKGLGTGEFDFGIEPI